MGRPKYNPRYPLRSFGNYLLVRMSYALGHQRSLGFPLAINLEPTNICNLKCPLCPTGAGTGIRPKGSMTFENFRRIIDELKPYTLELIMAGYGEPFIHPDICRMVKYASGAGLSVDLYSNGLLINTPEKISELVDSGLRKLVVAIDGATQETYEKYRVGGRLEVLLANLKGIVAEKARLASPWPEISPVMVVTRINEPEVEAVRRLLHDLGVENFSTRGALLTLARTRNFQDIPSQTIDTYLARERKYHGHKLAGGNTRKNKCKWLYEGAVIYWNGEVSICCHDTGFLKMGNLLEMGSFSRVWNGLKYRKLRKQVHRDVRQARPLCSQCPDRVAITADPDAPQTAPAVFPQHR